MACSPHELQSVGQGTFEATECAVTIRPALERRLSLMSDERLQQLAQSMPCVADERLAMLLESPNTVFYDEHGIVPGYQDSFGDGDVLPIGMRPNSIAAKMINLAVPGGHEQVFEERGTFHFPFGRPTGSENQDIVVINFWHIPEDESGQALPVVHWRRRPSGYTNRIDWSFPTGTVFGELMFLLTDNRHWMPFEIRTRTRQSSEWVADAFRPFQTATQLSEATVAHRDAEPHWQLDDSIDDLIAHLEDPSTLRPATLSSLRFPSAFDSVEGHEDPLPSVQSPDFFPSLIDTRPFESVKGQVWRASASSITYGPTASAPGSLVPPGYNGGLIPIDDNSCTRCHRDAGRPFKDYYGNIVAYGELWGQDETFTWHPFETSQFVRPDGSVKNFNHDNRRMRKDFVEAGLLEPFDPDRHLSDRYSVIPREWTDYTY